MRLPALLTLIALTPGLAHAVGFKGTLEYTDAERAEHLAKLPEALDIASRCLKDELKRHKDFMKEYGISAFYGDNSPFLKRTEADGKKRLTTIDERRQMLRDHDIDEALIPQMVPDAGMCQGGVQECPLLLQNTSCIGLAIKCFSKGMKETGQDPIWQKLRRYMLDNQSTGNSVIDGLQKLGWKVHYWNPDTSRNVKWDNEDQKKFPGNPQNIWGQHAAMWQSVQSRHMYYINKVDDWESMVDFGHKTPKVAKRAPFFFAIAHLGYHVFSGTYGKIFEGHSARDIDDKKTLESSWFSPMRFLGGGGPRGGPYKSGLVAIPPTESDDPDGTGDDNDDSGSR